MEPQTARDVTAPSPVKKNNGIEFKEGCRLEAKDHMGEKWWEAKVLEVDVEGSEVLVHFTGWNGRHDEWIKMDSPRLRSPSLTTRHVSGGSSIEGNLELTTSTIEPTGSPCAILRGSQTFSEGEEVLALWKQNQKYPATIISVQEEGSYLVKFYDGFEKTVKGQNIKKVEEGDMEFIAQCKVQINDEKNNQPESLNTNKDQGADLESPAKMRRERKSKFNVREILNLKETTRKKPITKGDANSSDKSSSEALESEDQLDDNCENLKIAEVCSVMEDENTDKGENAKEEITDIKKTVIDHQPAKQNEKSSAISETIGVFGNQSIANLKPKRARKRKKFADEEAEGNIPKAPKLSKNTKSVTINKKKNEPSQKPNQQSLNMINNSANLNSSKDVTSEKRTDGGIDRFPYLTMNLTQPTDQVLSKLIEGVNIPGVQKPIVMRCPKLPEGWQKKVVRRSEGDLRWDVLIENSEGRVFKNKTELTKYLEEKKEESHVDKFDFALDKTLKKLKQIIRSQLIVAEEKTVLSTPGKSVEDTSIQSSSKGIQLTAETVKDVDTLTPIKAPPKKALKSISFTPDKLSPKSIPEALPIQPQAAGVSSGMISPGSTFKGTVSETGQGVRCPLKNCNKLFRNEKLLQMHVKHYHPEYNNIVCNSPSVTDLAFHRTRLGEDFKELESGGILLENLKQAEKVVEQQFSFKDEKLADTEGLKISPAKRDKDHKETVDIVKIDNEHNSKCDETTSESQELAVDMETNETDSPLVEATSLSETDCLRVDVEDNIAPIEETEKLDGTPRGVGSKARPKRLRNDSILSVGSENDTFFSPPPSPLVSVVLTSQTTPPPSFKMSRRRAQQLRSAPTTPPNETKDNTETMSEGEVVHCACLHAEGDGMMVQCESCLTWQHGQCLGLEGEDQVPDKYICSVCLKPPLGRQSASYSLDTDWIREGQLIGLSSTERSDKLKRLSDLMADLLSLSSVLHSLQVKLVVAENRNNPKVFMWSTPWEGEDVDAEMPERMEETQEVINKTEPSENGPIGNDMANNDTKKLVNGDVLDEFFNEKYEKHERNGSEGRHRNNSDEKKAASGQEESKDGVSSSSNNRKPESNDSQNLGSELAQYFSGDGFDFPSMLLPSVSEMQRLLPGVIKDISSSQNFNSNFLPSAPNIIPEPKRLDRDECRQNLILHIEKMQEVVQKRMDYIEKEIDLIENSDESPSMSSIPSMATIIQDLRSAKRINNSSPERS